MARLSAARTLFLTLAATIAVAGCSPGQSNTDPAPTGKTLSDTVASNAADSGDNPPPVFEPKIAGIRNQPKPLWHLHVGGRPFTTRLDSGTALVNGQVTSDSAGTPVDWTLGSIGLDDGNPRWVIGDTTQLSVNATIAEEAILATGNPLGMWNAAGTVEILDAKTGTMRWEHPLDRSAWPTMVGRTVVLHYTDRALGIGVLSAEDGKALWSAPNGRWFTNSADPGSNLLYEIDGDILRVVASEDGQTLATAPVAHPDQTLSSVLFVRGDPPAIVLSFTDGFSTAFTVRTLTPLWQSTFAPPTQITSEIRYLVTKTDDDYTRLDQRTGRQLWTHRLSGSFPNGTRLLSAPGIVYIYGITTSGTVEVDAVDPETGAIRWQVTYPAVNSVELIPTDDVIYLYRQLDAPGTEWEMTAVDTRNGQRLWSLNVPYVIGGSPLPIDNGLIVTDADGVELLR